MAMNKKMGMMLAVNEVQLSILKAATKAPTNMRKMVPGPRMVPIININWRKKNNTLTIIQHTIA
jgi:hypothetical protein